MNFIWILALAMLVPMLLGAILAILIEYIEEKENK